MGAEVLVTKVEEVQAIVVAEVKVHQIVVVDVKEIKEEAKKKSKSE